jgi:uncharacterized protein
VKKRVYIIHGWGGNPEEHWLPWLKNQLELKGFEVIVPVMPDTDEPAIEKWVRKLSDVVGTPDARTYFVGHSIGCQTIMRYLAMLENIKVGGCIFVAGWFKLENLEDKHEERIAAPWLKNDINFTKVLKTTKNIAVINSQNDDYGCVEENKTLFEKNLKAEVFILENMGHFTSSDGVFEIPEVLTKFLSIAK